MLVLLLELKSSNLPRGKELSCVQMLETQKRTRRAADSAQNLMHVALCFEM